MPYSPKSMGFQSFIRKPYASSSSTNTSPQVLLLDGGFGTTLEDLFHLDISTSLWSAKPIDENPQVIIDTHLAFMKSGSDVVLSSTYQCSFETFERAGYSREEAIRLMRKSIQLVDQARQQFTSTTKEKKRDIKIALSLGPLGAMLVPTQEFIGVYPPPYGPCAFSEGRGDNKQNFDNEEDEEKAVEALAKWNEERLRVFLDDEETWKKVDCLAFETVPLTREIRGIRRAIGRLFGSSSTSSSSDLRKPWWISTVHPNGKFPEKGVSMKNVVEALLGDEDGSPKPDGVGINCTSMAYVPKLVERLTEETMKVPSLEGWPWLVLYPNGGQIWLPETRSWRLSNEGDHGGNWGTELGVLVEKIVEGDNWRGVVVGGCCKTLPKDIEKLAASVDKHRAQS